MAATDDKKAAQRLRPQVRLRPDTLTQVDYWANKHGVSRNDYMTEAIEQRIARENGDYDLPTLEIARLNQHTDLLMANTKALANLQQVVVSGFDSLLGLTRGDNYLTDEKDGELDA